MGNIFVAYHDI